MEEVLDLSAFVMMMLCIMSLALWFCCSAIVSIIKTRRRLKSSRYDVLLKENERLRKFLSEVEEENSHLREVYFRRAA
jgi:hypothetical protein